MTNYDKALVACQEELMGPICDIIEEKYEDEFEKYITDGGSKQFFRTIYPEVKNHIIVGLNDEEVREDMLQMDYGVDFSKISKYDIEDIAETITWDIVFYLLYAEPF